jgi:hypothetical protein
MKILELSKRIEQLGKELLKEKYGFSTTRAEVIAHSLDDHRIEYGVTLFQTGYLKSYNVKSVSWRKLEKLLRIEVEKETCIPADIEV